MNATITFYPVDNGCMALLKLNDSEETTLLIDMYIRTAADDEDEDAYDVAEHLRKQLNTDDEGRPYVDAFLLTHNDDDHISGIQDHFHLGPPSDYQNPEEDEEPKIIIKEMWNSCRFWKRSSNSNKLCDDAKAFNREMKRRVKLFEDKKSVQSAGNRALILCKDPEGKTDDIEDIVRDLDETFSIINERDLKGKLSIKVLGPLPQQKDEADEGFNEKNRGSVILSIRVTEAEYENVLLMPGDAGVFVWECLWNKFENNKTVLEYDVLLAPHHCSWHSLSHDSQSNSDDPQVSDDAKSALSQAKEGAYIISSSKPIKDDDNDPPSHAAKEEYLTVVDKKYFLCTGEYPKENNVEPIVINLTGSGPQRKQPKAKARLAAAAISATGEAFPHG